MWRTWLRDLGPGASRSHVFADHEGAYLVVVQFDPKYVVYVVVQISFTHFSSYFLEPLYSLFIFLNFISGLSIEQIVNDT